MCRSEALSVNSEFQSGFCETLKNTVFEQLSLIHHQLLAVSDRRSKSTFHISTLHQAN